MAFWDLDPDLFGVAGTGDVTRRALDLVQAGDIDGLAAVLTASTVAGVKQSCLSLAAYLGALEPLRVLLERGAAEAEGSAELSCLAELLHVVAPQSPADRALLGTPAVAIAACRLHVEALDLLLRHCTVLPGVGDEARGSLPLLPYWAAGLSADAADSPAALAVLRRLLAAGADPLQSHVVPHPAAGTGVARGLVRGRNGHIASFLLTCSSPALLGAAVQHVLAGCAEGRRAELSPSDVAVMLVAARLAGLEAESDALAAQAVSQGTCFPIADNAERGERASGSTQRRAAAAHCRAAAAVHGPRSASASPSRSSGPSSSGAGPSSGGTRPPWFHMSPWDPDHSPSRGERRAWLLEQSLRRRWHQAQPGGAAAAGADGAGTGAAAAAAAAGDLVEAGWEEEVELPSASASQRQQHLRAQLVADAAAHGLNDVLALLLGQGASPSAKVMWVPDPQPPGASGIPATLPPPTGMRCPLALAAAGGHASTMAQLLHHGALPDLSVLRHAVWSMNAEGVAGLLKLWTGSPPRISPSSYAEAALHCPILLLLHRHLELTWVAAARAAAATVPSSASLSALNTMSAALSRTAGGLWETNAPAAALAGPPVVPPAHHGWMIAAAKRAAPELASLEASAVSIMDALHTAGYRIHIYRDMCGRGADGVWRMGRMEGLQPDELEKLRVRGRNRLVWDAYCRLAWSRATHKRFHPRFRAAAAELLLVARCGETKLEAQAESGEGAGSSRRAARRGASSDGGAGSESAASVAVAALGRLPQELVDRIIAEAAYPLSNWVHAG
ncbi:hypothetical protein C2E20_3604 [Micractinium conductrix]|uniref:Ankyrin repeat n=1 Tax=Micractinium conductrix TaxID=554055 RepID=A0A2P6VFU2_9CHLO|nr:hypothetical protein C2E20_3604 [Micractinium conductrix]|eukprot:PSC72966.1 hypothetical protein C2E20_3604 [Micractinium conductrix]